jgi:hypothetical protein
MVLGAPLAIRKGLMVSNRISEQDMERWMRFQPPYVQAVGSYGVWPYRNNAGEIEAYNWTRPHPAGSFWRQANIIKGIVKNQTGWGDLIAETGGLGGLPVAVITTLGSSRGEEPPVDAFTRQPTFNPMFDTAAQRTGKLGVWAAETIGPKYSPIARKAQSVGKVDAYGRPSTTTTADVWRQVVGFQPIKQTAIGREVSKIKKMADLSKWYGTWVAQNPNASPEALARVQKTLNERLKELSE